VFVRFRGEVGEKWFFELVFLGKERKCYRERGLGGHAEAQRAQREMNEALGFGGVCLPLTSFGDSEGE